MVLDKSLTVKQLKIYGDNLLNADHYSEALDYYNAVLFKSPTYWKAYYNRGSCYLELNELEKALANYLKADKYNPNNSETLMMIGCIYHDLGRYNLALPYLLKAAENGKSEDVVIQVCISDCYLMRSDTDRDHFKSFYWAKKAADQGNPDAQYRVGVFYFEGKAVERNLAQALIWYAKAAEQGVESAKERLIECESEISSLSSHPSALEQTDESQYSEPDLYEDVLDAALVNFEKSDAYKYAVKAVKCNNRICPECGSKDAVYSCDVSYLSSDFLKTVDIYFSGDQNTQGRGYHCYLCLHCGNRGVDL